MMILRSPVGSSFSAPIRVFSFFDSWCFLLRSPAISLLRLDEGSALGGVGAGSVASSDLHPVRNKAKIKAVRILMDQEKHVLSAIATLGKLWFLFFNVGSENH